MAGTRLLLDTGPLVGYLNARDQHHAWARHCWEAAFDPFWTCEPVISEAVFVLQSERLSVDPLLRLMERGVICLEFSLEAHRVDVFRLMRKYEDQPMSVADACLVRMAELETDCHVVTTDRDFQVYRRSGRGVIPLLAPWTTS
jgi:predicted nucleic acid-binding protein